MICAVCLREGRPLVERSRIWNDGIEQPRTPIAAPALTIEGGTAYCREHLPPSWSTRNLDG